MRTARSSLIRLPRLQRAHFNRNGTEKIRYATRDEAKSEAIRIAGELGVTQGFDTYWCRLCHMFHLGNRRMPKQDINEIHILGARVGWALKMENTGSTTRRTNIIKAVGFSAQKKARNKLKGSG